MSDGARKRSLAGLAVVANWLNSSQGRGVLKCTLAYTLASLWTFWAPLSAILGQPDGKHVVATITVYFHPARSLGSMIEAVLIAIVAVGYAEAVSILSMCTSVLVGGVWGMVALAHVLVLVVFIGGGFGVMGWIKQRLNNPLVNVGSTLASLAITSIVTKEAAVLDSVFSDRRIVQIFQMLVFGIMTTTAVNLLVWRVSAITLLRASMITTSTSLGEMLALITSSFLTGSEEALKSSEFSAASSSYAASHPQVVRNLRESKFERYLLGGEKLYRLDRAIVRSMENLARSVGGLRSAANTQFTLLAEPAVGPLGISSPMLSHSSSNVAKSKDRFQVLSSIEERSEDGSGTEPDTGRGQGLHKSAEQPPNMRTASDIFDLFVALLGPPMKSLAYTLAEILREHPFGCSPDYNVTVNDNFRSSLTDALGLFNVARAVALEELYKQLELDHARTEQLQADFEEVAAACGHFSFSLQAFGEEMQKYLDILDDLRHLQERHRRSWSWMMWWHRERGPGRLKTALTFDPEEQELPVKPIKKTATPRIPDPLLKRRDMANWDAAPESRKTVAFLSQRLLHALRFLGRDDGRSRPAYQCHVGVVYADDILAEVRFGLKVGLGAALWAMFAFIPKTRHIYQHWRGEWGLLSFMIVCSMTLGSANTNGLSRFLGTLIGISAAYVNWTVTGGNAIGLIMLGWFVAFWSFWMIVARGKAPLGRITLLAYNVTTLYAYLLSQKVDEQDDDEGGQNPDISVIIMHRALAVTAGILWGLVVCRVIWPISARKKFKQGLSVLLLQMGLIWMRGPLAILLRNDASRSYLKLGEQEALQKYLSRLEGLRNSAKFEFQLRGPFPTEQSGRIMSSTKRILDAFYAMSLVTQRQGNITDGERALLEYTAQERRVLCDRICQVFQVLASSIMLEYPLAHAVPAIMGLRDDLLSKIFQFRKEHLGHLAASAGPSEDADAVSCVRVEERDYALLYAYALVTGQVAEELKAVGKQIELLYGVLDDGTLLLQ